MNFRFVINQLGLLLVVFSGILIGIGAWAAFEWLLLDDLSERPATFAMFISAAVGLIVGGGLWATTRGAGVFGRREALLLVAITWLLGAALAALPFYLWANVDANHAPDHAFGRFINCYFESMSGLTTTGATILEDIPTVPRSMLLWRAMTHWLGGLGIVVLFVAVLPSLGVGGKKLFKVEAPGPKAEGVTPHIRETARVLWMIYLGLTLAQIIALRIAGLNWFESVCHTFATLATGGFSTHNASIAAYDSVAVDIIVIVFMLLAGVNFGLYYQAMRGKLRSIWRDTELRLYLGCLVGATLIITTALVGSTIHTTAGESIDHAGVGDSVRYAAFQAVSVQTTTGFCTADFDRWPFVAQAVLLVMMFIGGSAGSTGGGIKVIRIWLMLKVLRAEIERAFRPQVVRAMKVGGAPIEPDMRLGAVTYVLTMVLLVGLGAVLLVVIERGAMHEVSFTTAATASIATLFNIGPGLEGVGATQNYAHFTDSSKIIMSTLMALGRLELFAIIVLFSPRFWRGD
jgi:trk system potassium uptake protein TrkH